MRADRALTLLSLTALPLIALHCPPPGGGGDDTSGDTGPLVEDDTGPGGGDDSGEACTGFHGTITGNLQVQLYTLDSDGEYVFISWADAYNDVFIFGDAIMFAYTPGGDDGTATETYYDEYVINSPSTTGDSYELSVDDDGVDTVRVFGALDYWGDKIIGTGDPVGNYPDEIADPDPCSPDTVVSGVDVTILIPYWDGSSSGCGGSGGGNGNGSTTIDGTIIITTAYAGGDAAAMVLDTSDNGPYYSTIETPTPVGGGAEADYSLTVCSSLGQANLVGAHDANFNGLFDPAGDQWGVYAPETDVNGNPIDLSENHTDADIQIPFGFDGLDLTPFVRIYGNVWTDESLPSGTQVYAAALKYRPNTDIYTSDLADGYDYEVFDSAAVAAGDPWAYSHVVPGDTIAYVWAYADTDNDGAINEDGEPVGAYGDENTGRLPTGGQSHNVDLELRVVE